MSYSQKQLFEIGKKLIIFSGKKGKITAGEKKKIIPQLELLLTQTKQDSSVMGKRVNLFITDILDDIHSDRPINIDSIVEDEYVKNFLQAEKCVKSYNSLLTKGDYNKLMGSIKENSLKKSYSNANILKNYVKEVLREIDTQRFSELLLIMEIFHVSQVGEYYHQLYSKSIKYNNIKTAQVLLEVIGMISKFHHDVQSRGMSNIEDQKIETTYMICDIKNNKLSFLPIKITDKSSASLEYRKVILEKFKV